MALKTNKGDRKIKTIQITCDGVSQLRDNQLCVSQWVDKTITLTNENAKNKVYIDALIEVKPRLNQLERYCATLELAVTVEVPDDFEPTPLLRFWNYVEDE